MPPTRCDWAWNDVPMVMLLGHSVLGVLVATGSNVLDSLQTSCTGTKVRDSFWKIDAESACPDFPASIMTREFDTTAHKVNIRSTVLR